MESGGKTEPPKGISTVVGWKKKEKKQGVEIQRNWAGEPLVGPTIKDRKAGKKRRKRNRRRQSAEKGTGKKSPRGKNSKTTPPQHIKSGGGHPQKRGSTGCRRPGKKKGRWAGANFHQNTLDQKEPRARGKRQQGTDGRKKRKQGKLGGHKLNLPVFR